MAHHLRLHCPFLRQVWEKMHVWSGNTVVVPDNALFPIEEWRNSSLKNFNKKQKTNHDCIFVSFNMRTILLFVSIILHKLLHVCVISFLPPTSSKSCCLPLVLAMCIHDWLICRTINIAELLKSLYESVVYGCRLSLTKSTMAEGFPLKCKGLGRVYLNVSLWNV